MVHRDIIVIGASAGGVEAFKEIASGFDRDFAASIFMVLHIPSDYRSILPQIISNVSRLHALHPRDGQPFNPGTIYIAPADSHLILKSGTIHLTKGPKNDRHRPSIDVLFESAAQEYGPRVIGVVLTGWGKDGSSGLLAIKKAGGLAIIQDPEDASVPEMPMNAAETVQVDYSLKLKEIPPLLKLLVQTPASQSSAKESNASSNRIEREVSKFANGEERSTGTMLTCPECGGVLWELQNGEITKYVCHVGHSYNDSALVKQQSENIEQALWKSIRLFREKAALSRRLAVLAASKGRSLAEKAFREDARDADKNADRIETLLSDGISQRREKVYEKKSQERSSM
jgi:two-component system chemotaxis response regulator CheB